MSKIHTLKKLWKEDKKRIIVAIFNNIIQIGILNGLPDKVFLQIVYFVNFGRKLDLKNPRTFNQKLQWLKLYDRNPDYVKMVDKYAVKQFVADKIGEEYIIPTLGVWESVEQIDFNELPEQFVLKGSHDSGSVIICNDRDNFDEKSAKKKMSKCIKRNLFFWGREWPYKDVKPRIIAEKYMVDSSIGELRDYKIWCFNGEPKITLVCSERFSETGLCEDFYDMEWNHLIIKRPNHPNSTFSIERPKNYDLMQCLARKLAVGIPFIRVDFYEIDGKVYFGEMTFFPASGFEAFEPEEWDLRLGEYIKMPCTVVDF